MAEQPSITEGPAIGIDLGTTFSCVAVVINGKVEVIANEQGNYTTPSFVAFNEHERLIGDAAKLQLAANSINTIFDVKRMIGRSFDDPIVQKDILQWPFTVVDINGMPKIEIKYKGEFKLFSAEEISAMVLGKMKEIAESYLNAPVKNAVVTVPAYFSDMQRKSTKDAGTIAGLNVSCIINEPTAAAIAYGLSKDTKDAKNILVYDLGGGTFDVSILNICENVYEVKATAGDTHLGGEDFDNVLMESFAAEFKRKNNVEINGNKRALRRLRTACERAKRTLSSTTSTTIEIDALCDGIDFFAHLSRARFDDMCGDLFRSTITVVLDALDDANLKCDDIDTIVLVGGSTRIPKIQQLLQDLFKGKEINKTINPDEAVAYGAAVQAAINHGGASAEMENMKLMEVTPLTLGVSIRKEHIMSAIIKRNTPIPVSRNRRYVTLEDDQTSLRFPIIQGERHLAKDNFEIGKTTIHGLTPAPRGVEGATVTFSIDANGILTVTAVSESDENNRGEIKLENVCGSLTKDEIDQMVADAEKYREQDNKVKQYYTARTELEQYCYELKREFRWKNEMVFKKCNEVLYWLNKCCRPTVSQFIQKKEELHALAYPPEDESTVEDSAEMFSTDETDGSDNDVREAKETNENENKLTQLFRWVLSKF